MTLADVLILVIVAATCLFAVVVGSVLFRWSRSRVAKRFYKEDD